MTDRPLLRILLQLLAAKSVGSLSGAEAGVAELLHKELTEVKDSLKAPQQQINLR